jgi:hypothetical protein
VRNNVVCVVCELVDWQATAACCPLPAGHGCLLPAVSDWWQCSAALCVVRDCMHVVCSCAFLLVCLACLLACWKMRSLLCVKVCMRLLCVITACVCCVL